MSGYSWRNSQGASSVMCGAWTVGGEEAAWARHGHAFLKYITRQNIEQYTKHTNVPRHGTSVVESVNIGGESPFYTPRTLTPARVLPASRHSGACAGLWAVRSSWAAQIGLGDKRVPPRPLAAGGRLTLNRLTHFWSASEPLGTTVT